MKRRRMRTLVLAGYLTAGAFLMQFGTLCTSAGTASVSSSGLLIDDNGYLLGLFYVCGDPNFVLVDPDGVQLSEVQNSEDDLMFGCPAARVTVAP